ncbi:DUF4307 domain-containing protein [Cellulomonas sp. P22]|uniref:DUF4307 domain-containing protein n=1 Tax=Cellulomonas sp. P22 TaxID=3373189 RepID=UPI0037BBB351
MSESMPVGPPAGRYGPVARQRRRPAWVLPAAVVGVVAIPVGVWIGVGVLRDPVQWSTVGFSVTGVDNVDLTFQVTRDVGQTVQCQVHALSTSYAEVGVRTVVVPPSDERTQRVTESIPTAEEATTAEVLGCEQVTEGTTVED